MIGLLLAAMAVPAMWVDQNIVQEDGFVRLASPLGKEPEFQRRLASAAVASFNPAGQIPDFMADGMAPVLEAAAGSLTGLPGYPAAWEETLRKSHRLSFTDPGSLPPEADASTSLTLDVAPLLGLLTRQLSETTGVPFNPPGETLINIGQSGHRELIANLSAYAPMGYAMAVGSGIAFVLALVAARRRWVIFLVAGVGGLFMAALWKLGSDLASAAVSAMPSGNSVAEVFQQELVNASAASFGQWITTSFWTGGFLLLAGIVLAIFPGRRV
ncbi:hypothetical protein M1D88_14515 [Arthrobacter sp. R1-13]